MDAADQRHVGAVLGAARPDAGQVLARQLKTPRSITRRTLCAGVGEGVMEDVERPLARPDGELEPGARARVPQGHADGVGRGIPHQADVQLVIAAMGEFAEFGHGPMESSTRAKLAPAAWTTP